MSRVLVGLETEYGFTVEGHGPAEQIEDAVAFVRCADQDCWVGWDYSHETPRADLRGFSVNRLQQDPLDAKFDAGREAWSDQDIRSDRVLWNGARFYNDHGHPEYSTPECWSLDTLAAAEAEGDGFVLATARKFESHIGRRVKVYKNNSDGHGASFGTHENYLVPRSIGFDLLYSALVPILVARTVVCGAGKCGSEAGAPCNYQLSQRADFMVSRASVDTLFSRPVFNTRDESHSDPRSWIRLHVICGDANRIPVATLRKFAFVRLGIWLALAGECPKWPLSDPPASMKAVSRDLSAKGEIGLEGHKWTTAFEILSSYVEHGERILDPSLPDICETLAVCRTALEDLEAVVVCKPGAGRTIDWMVKKTMLEGVMQQAGLTWDSPEIASYALAYHDLDPNESLYTGLVDTGFVDRIEPPLPESSTARTRSMAREVAVRKFPHELTGVSWRRLTFGDRGSVDLRPEIVYPDELSECQSVEEFINMIEALK